MELKHILEALLFAATNIVTTAELTKLVRKGADPALPEAESFAKVTEEEVEAGLQSLKADLADRPVFLQEIAGGWQLGTAPAYARWVGEQVTELKPARMSQPALETLAVIAYRQPISRAEIEAVRGVAVSGVLETLVERGVVRVAGRADIPGRPLIYETTEMFLQHFGLKDLRELPNAEELRRAKLPEPVDPALAANQPELLHEPEPVTNQD
jgi:segregation and condensation protein B